MERILLILLLFPILSIGQTNDVLDSFYDEVSKLKGFKDSTGNVVIEAKFGFFSSAPRFNKVIAVSEINEGKKTDEYYLLRNGKKFGRDSLYLGDFSYDCESEGFIRFKDPNTGLIGMFDAKAEIAIPAEYNYISIVRNGFVIGLKNATKELLHQGQASCNHFKWKGGTYYLMNTNNEIQIKAFDPNNNLKWSSYIKTDSITDNPFRKHFTDINGQIISFIDNELEFKAFIDSFIIDLDIEKLSKNCFDELIHSDSKKWKLSSKEEHLEYKGNQIIQSIQSIKNPNNTHSCSITEDIPIPDKLQYIRNKRLDNCGRIKIGEYPMYRLGIMKYDKNGKYKSMDSFYFMKFDGKIKLISPILRNN